MLKDIVAVKPLGEYSLYLRFEDGAEGIVDLAGHLAFRGVFEPLRDTAYFALVRVDNELGTVARPNGADLDPMCCTRSSRGYRLHSNRSGFPPDARPHARR